MRKHHHLGRIVANCVFLMLLALLASGCETPGWAERLDEAFTPAPKVTPQDVEQHRTRYFKSRDREELYWLLRHEVESGMSYEDVCHAIGQNGVPEKHDTWVKTNGGNYQLGDHVYAFGPDNQGQTVYLVFRENKLVNFDPTEFSSSGRPKPKKEDETE